MTKANPNLTPQQTWEANTGTLLKTLQDQYISFFTDVGTAQRAGTLTAAQVSELNSKGVILKTTLEKANTLFKQFEVTKDEQLKVQVIGLITTSEQIVFDLTTRKAAMTAPPGGK